MIDSPVYPVIAAMALCGYLVVRIRMNDAAQPLRLEMARRGESLLANPALPKLWKEYVHFQLDRAFGATVHLMWGVVLIPLAAIAVVFCDKATQKLEVEDKATKLDLMEFCALSEEVGLLNNPLLKTLTALEMNACLLTAALLRIIFSSAAPKVEKKQVIEVVREWEASIGGRVPFAAA
jgi:hypothetical protein